MLELRLLRGLDTLTVVKKIFSCTSTDTIRPCGLQSAGGRCQRLLQSKAACCRSTPPSSCSAGSDLGIQERDVPATEDLGHEGAPLLQDVRDNGQSSQDELSLDELIHVVEPGDCIPGTTASVERNS